MKRFFGKGVFKKNVQHLGNSFHQFIFSFFSFLHLYKSWNSGQSIFEQSRSTMHFFAFYNTSKLFKKATQFNNSSHQAGSYAQLNSNSKILKIKEKKINYFLNCFFSKLFFSYIFFSSFIVLNFFLNLFFFFFCFWLLLLKHF